jgi:hypothetical protein
MISADELSSWGFGGKLVYQLSLPVETPSNNVIKGMHFQVYKQTRWSWRLMVQNALKGFRPESPIERSGLVIVRHCAGELDWDNAYGGLKPMLDCLVAPSTRNPDGLGLIRDDSPKSMPYPPFFKQVKAKPGHGATEVFIYQLD